MNAGDRRPPLIRAAAGPLYGLLQATPDMDL